MVTVCCNTFMPQPTEYTTGDGRTVHSGAAVFSHYSMREGVIGTGDPTGWFYLVYPDGGRDLLNGERICSLQHARRMGWL